MQLVGWPVVWVGFSGKVMTTAETCTQAQQVQFPQGCVQICHCRLLCVALSENGVWALFRYPQNSKFFHSLSITSIFGRMHEALNVGKKNN